MTKKEKMKTEEKQYAEEQEMNGASKEEKREDAVATDEEQGESAAKEEKEEETEEDSVDALKGELEAQQDKYIRLMAEFDNFKRRTSREYERMVESANERLMLDIIEPRESLERALSMADENHDLAKFLEGMQHIFNKLNGVLEKNGLTVFTEVGDEFNAELHDAMMKIPHESIPEDHIVQIYENGYRLKKRVIKHAKVIVSSGAPEGSSADESKETVSV